MVGGYDRHDRWLHSQRKRARFSAGRILRGPRSHVCSRCSREHPAGLSGESYSRNSRSSPCCPFSNLPESPAPLFEHHQHQRRELSAQEKRAFLLDKFATVGLRVDLPTESNDPRLAPSSGGISMALIGPQALPQADCDHCQRITVLSLMC
jgi:hypothetical protein